MLIKIPLSIQRLRSSHHPHFSTNCYGRDGRVSDGIVISDGGGKSGGGVGCSCEGSGVGEDSSTGDGDCVDDSGSGVGCGGSVHCRRCCIGSDDVDDNGDDDDDGG